MFTVGTNANKTLTCTEQNTALALGSGSLPVLATPAMVALMEGTCVQLVEPMLEAGQTTVGTALNITHSAPTALGGQVTCNATLTACEGRKLCFSLRVEGQNGLVGEGTHERFVVDIERFMSKLK